MAPKIQSIRGTRDILPAESYKWQYIERVALEVAAGYGMNEIRLPTIEKTDLFVRSVGETTDVVQKEMYSFKKGRETISLRPEGTAGSVRALLQNGMLNDALPVKMSYLLSCFRHENPQAGRLREFHQFGVEVFGSTAASADAEIIAVTTDIFDRLGIGNAVTLQINSIGCPACRPAYNRLLVDYFQSRRDELCEVCQTRLEKNPLRVLDCKIESCAPVIQDAPLIPSHLCGECEEHFSRLQTRLDALDIAFTVNPRLVRGLDYYTKTVFEFMADSAGAQGTVCGGGRYDGLVELMGGPPTPGLGFGMGLERLLMVMEAEGCAFPPPDRPAIYIGSMGEPENIRALALCHALRRAGFFAVCDTMERSVRAQMKYANKIDAAYACILGSRELEEKQVDLKDMESGENIPVALDAGALEQFLRREL